MDLANVHENWQRAAPVPSKARGASKRKKRGAGSLRALWGVLRMSAIIASVLGVIMALRDVNSGVPPSKQPSQSQAASTIASTDHGGLDLNKVRFAAGVLDVELMKSMPDPRKFDPKYKSPCWEEGGTVRCLPAALIAGVFHSGSNSLSAKLLKHSSIAADVSSGSQFWGESEKKTDAYVTGFAAFSKAATENPGLSLIDHSQSTFSFYWSAGLRTHRLAHEHLKSVWRNCSETASASTEAKDACLERDAYPHALALDSKAAESVGLTFDDLHVPLLVRAAYGDWPLKLIVMLRDPLDRIHSSFWNHFHYRNKYGETPEGFLKFVDEQIAEFEGCVARGHSSTQCVLYFESLGLREERTFFHCDQLFRGTYSVYLEQWNRLLGRDSILVLKSEDYFANSRDTLGKVIAFLGLPAASASELQAMDAVKPKSYAKGKVMLPAARKKLQRFYKPFNNDLQKMVALNGGNTNFLTWDL